MSLRNQPYLPLYIQDVLTDEKLIECSAEAHGVYFRLLCILHKQEEYGVVCIKQKYKQSESKFENFASMFAIQMPFSQEQIAKCLVELHDENVIYIDDDCLYQKRMKKDGLISIMRSEIGKTGGSSVTKQYGKEGYLYLMSDGYDKNKIGISVNPQNRLYRLRSGLKLPKHFEIKQLIEVNDMGKSEDFAIDFFKENIDGEWVIDSFDNVNKKFTLLKAKLQANAQAKTEANSENENENNSINNNEEKKVEIPIDSVCYNVEEYLLANQVKFEAICIKTNKTLVEAKNELMKCHLHLEKHEKYPMAKKAALAWVTSWMINAKDFNAKYLPSQAEKKSTEAPRKNIDELVKKYQK